MLQKAAVSLKQILVVDTNACRCLAREFPRDQFNITAVGDPEEAVSLIQSHDYDVALIDVDMPSRNSFGLLRRIRRERPMTKVIMMTDYGDEELWVDAVNEGACDLLAKPIQRREVERRL